MRRLDCYILLQAVNFFCFDMYRKAFLKAVGPELRNEAKVAAGALAGENLFPTLHSCRKDVLSTSVPCTCHSAFQSNLLVKVAQYK